MNTQHLALVIAVSIASIVSPLAAEVTVPATRPAKTPPPAPPALPPTVTADEESLTIEPVALAPEVRAAGGFLALPIVSEVAKGALKYVLRAVGSSIESYAEQFGAAYDTKKVLTNFDPASTVADRYGFIVRRTLTFTNVTDALKAFQVNSPADFAPHTYRNNGDTNIQVDALVVPFALEVNPGRVKTCWRFVPFPSSHTTDATQIIVQGLAGKVLQRSGKLDDFHMVIGVSFREAVNLRGADAIQETDPVTLKLTAKQLVGKKPITKQFQSDWIPCPVREAYSVKVTVLESSRMKEWLQKAAKKMVEFGEKKVDALEFK